MSYDYDYDYSNVRTNTRNTRYVSNSAPARRMNEEQMRRMVNKSTNGSRSQNKPRVVKVYADRAKKAIVALCCVCIVAASGITAGTINAINDFKENQIVSQYSSEYRKEAIGHNTHRTYDNQHYYYDHADVHDDGMDYLQQEGVLSTSGRLNDKTAEELSIYFAYKNFVENQMKKFFNENRYSCDTLEEYVQRKGFKSVEEWSDKMAEKVVFLDKAKSEGYELQQMIQEADKIEDVAKDNLNLGGK